MEEWQKRVLEAEAAVQALAEELAKAKGIVDNVAAIEGRLSEAVKALEDAQAILEGRAAQAHDALNQASRMLDEIRSRIEEYINEDNARSKQLSKRLLACLVMVAISLCILLAILALHFPLR